MRIRTPLTVGFIGLFTLAACTDPAYQTGGDRQRTRDGAVAGALVGAVVGASRPGGDDLRQAAVGATVGALVGGAIGSALDAQAAALRRDLPDDRIRIVNTGNELVVTMPQDILFAVDSTAVRADLQDDLAVVARNLLDYPNTTIQVIGHTDNTGTAAYNQDLSQRRAAAVAAILRSNGVPSSRIVAIGRGEDQPIASNLSPEGRAQNRRVEIIIRPTR